MRLLRIPHRLLVAALLAMTGSILVLPEGALACGDVRDWLAKYEDPAATDENRMTALHDLAAPCAGHEAEAFDARILAVLVDALARGYPAAAVQPVFERYGCLAAASGEPAYETLRQRLDTSRCPASAGQG